MDVAMPHRHVHTHGPGVAPAPKHSGTLFFHLDDGVTLVEKAELTETRYVVCGVGEGQARIAQGRSGHWIPPTFLSWDHTSSAA